MSFLKREASLFKILKEFEKEDGVSVVREDY